MEHDLYLTDVCEPEPQPQEQFTAQCTFCFYHQTKEEALVGSTNLLFRRLAFHTVLNVAILPALTPTEADPEAASVGQIQIDLSKCKWRLTRAHVELQNIGGNFRYPTSLDHCYLNSLSIQVASDNIGLIIPNLPLDKVISITLPKESVQKVSFDLITNRNDIEAFGVNQDALYIQSSRSAAFIKQFWEDKLIADFAVAVLHAVPDGTFMTKMANLLPAISSFKIMKQRAEDVPLFESMSLKECKDVAQILVEHNADWLVTPYLNDANSRFVGALDQLRLDKAKIRETLADHSFEDVTKAVEPLLDIYERTKDDTFFSKDFTVETLIELLNNNGKLTDDQKLVVLIEGILALPVEIEKLNSTKIGRIYLGQDH